jgi:hypothetical protein
MTPDLEARIQRIADGAHTTGPAVLKIEIANVVNDAIKAERDRASVERAQAINDQLDPPKVRPSARETYETYMSKEPAKL